MGYRVGPALVVIVQALVTIAQALATTEPEAAIMEARLITLKLLLDELGISSDIETIDDRKRVQKAVYLAQRTGVDLSYRFGWYLMGPYSPALTRDYYSLADAIGSGDQDVDGRQLQGAVKERLKGAKPLLSKPHTVKLSLEQWLELVASYDFLRRVSKQNHEEAVQTLQREKNELAGYVDTARAKLEHAGFLESSDRAV